MVSVQTSSGVNEALTISLEARLRQYLQSKMHSLVSNIFNREIHLPSAEKVWHIPQATELPRLPLTPFLSTPLEVQATSYLAASESISNFFCMVICSCTITPIISSLFANICLSYCNTFCQIKQAKKNICLSC